MTKKLFILSILTLSSMLASAQAVINFDKTRHDYGKFTENEVQTCVFNFTNKGNEPLVIHQAIASCGCTVPTYTKEPIAPGKTGQLKVVYNGRGKVPGTFRKTISIRSNASNTLVRVYVEGDMIDEKKK